MSKEYWDKRYQSEGEIWGKLPSKTALYAKKLFMENSVHKILIPGSGYGRNADFFYTKGFDVTGIEISEHAVNIAKINNPNIIYYNGTVLDMPFNSEVYDAIYCFNLLHLFMKGDRILFVEKCYNQIKDKGFAFFVVISDKESTFGKGYKIEENTYESEAGKPIHYFNEKDLLHHFKRFTVVEKGLIDEFENHGEKGKHIHKVRYIFAQK